MYSMNLVILDANFLMVPSQFGVDVYEELRMRLTGKLQLIIVPEVLDELSNKMDGHASTKFQRNVKMAFQLLKHQQQQYPECFVTLPEGNTLNAPVDDYLILKALQYSSNRDDRIYIATNDKELRKKSSQKGIRVIYLRQKKLLEISS